MAFILVIIVSRDGFALDVAVDVVTWTGLAEPDRRSGSALSLIHISEPTRPY